MINRYTLLLVLAVMLQGCQQGGRNIIPTSEKDGAPSRLLSPEEAARIPDAVPRVEVRTKAGNKSPYTVLGKTYRVMPESTGYKERGYASWYGTKFHGQKTSNGEDYDLYAMTAAHKTLPIPSYVRVTNLENGKKIVVRVNDRGPFHEGRIIDLSYAGAAKLGFGGTARVEVEAIDPRAYAATQPTPTATPPESIAFPATSGRDELIAEAQEEIIEKANTPSNSNAVGQQVFLQLGAFSNETLAKNLQRRAQQALNANVVISINPTNHAHRVRVGPISAEDVEVVEAAIRQAQLGESIVVME